MSKQLHKPHVNCQGFSLTEVIIAIALVGAIAAFAVPKFMQQSNVSMSKAKIESNRENIANIVKQADGELGFLPDHMGPAKLLEKYDSYALQDSLDAEFVQSSTPKNTGKSGSKPASNSATPKATKYIHVDGQEIAVSDAVGGCSVAESGDLMDNPNDELMIYTTPQGVLLTQKYWNTSSGQAKVCITDSIEPNSPAKYIVLDRGGKAQTTQVATASTDPTENPNTEPPVTPPVTPPTGTPTTPPTVLTAVFQSSIANVPIPSFQVQLDQCKNSKGEALAGTVKTTVSGGRATFNNTMPQGATSCQMSYLPAITKTGAAAADPIPGFQTPPSQIVQFSQGNSSYEWITLYPMVTLEVALQASAPTKCTGDNTSTPPTPPSLSGASVAVNCKSEYGNYSATQTTNSQGKTRFSPINPGSACWLQVTQTNAEPYITPVDQPIIVTGNNSVVQSAPPISLVSSLSTLVVWSHKYSLYPSPGVDEGPLPGTRVTSSYQNSSVTSDVGGVAVFRDIPRNTSVNLTATQTGYNSASATVSMANKCVVQDINMTYMPKGSVKVFVNKYNLDSGASEGALLTPLTDVTYLNTTKRTSSNANFVIFSNVDYGTKFGVSNASASGYTFQTGSSQIVTVNAPNHETTIQMGYMPKVSIADALVFKSKNQPDGLATNLGGVSVALSGCSLAGAYTTNSSGKIIRTTSSPAAWPNLPKNESCQVTGTLSNTNGTYYQETPQPITINNGNAAGNQVVYLNKPSGTVTIQTRVQNVDRNGNAIGSPTNLSGVIVTLNNAITPNNINGSSYTFNAVPYTRYSNQRYTVTYNNLPPDTNPPNPVVSFDFNEATATKVITFTKLLRVSLTITTQLKSSPTSTPYAADYPLELIECPSNGTRQITSSQNGNIYTAQFTGIEAGSTCRVIGRKPKYVDGYTFPVLMNTNQSRTLVLNQEKGSFYIQALHGSSPISGIKINVTCGSGPTQTSREATTYTNFSTYRTAADFYEMPYTTLENGPCKITALTDINNSFVLNETLPKEFNFSQFDQQVTVSVRPIPTSLTVHVKNEIDKSFESGVTVTNSCQNPSQTSTGYEASPIVFTGISRPATCTLTATKTNFNTVSKTITLTEPTQTETIEIKPQTSFLFIFNTWGSDFNGTIEAFLRNHGSGYYETVRNHLASLLSNFVGNATAIAESMLRLQSTTHHNLHQWVTYNASTNSVANTDADSASADRSTSDNLLHGCDYDGVTFYSAGNAYNDPGCLQETNGSITHIDNRNQENSNSFNYPDIPFLWGNGAEPVYVKKTLPNGQVQWFQYLSYWHTPVKLSLTPVSAKINSDGGFWIDVDGPNEVTEDPFMTTGGLNTMEAWLVLDRNFDGFVHNGLLDGDDVFGDHLGRFVNGYEDLKYTLKPWVKTDKHGEYIELTTIPAHERLWIGLTRLFGLNREYIPSYDLKLLTRSQNVIEASHVIKRIDVTYRNVQEFDAKHKNVIWQRSNVTYLNGKKAESADQYFQKIKGLRQLSPAEVDALIKQGKVKPPVKKAA